jgi:hypothetical protein
MVRADKASELNDMVVNKFVLKELLEVETQLRKITVNTTTDGENISKHEIRSDNETLLTRYFNQEKSRQKICACIQQVLKVKNNDNKTLPSVLISAIAEPCMVTSIWWHWNYSLSKMESDPVILSTVARSGFSHPLGFTMPRKNTNRSRTLLFNYNHKQLASTFLGGYEVKYGRVVSARVIKTQFVFTTRLDYQDSLTQLYNAIEETVLAMNKTAVYSSFFVETSVSRSQTKVKPTKIHFTNTSSRHQ